MLHTSFRVHFTLEEEISSSGVNLKKKTEKILRQLFEYTCKDIGVLGSPVRPCHSSAVNLRGMLQTTIINKVP